MGEPATHERRVFADRRSRPTSPFTLAGLRGSRTAVRRKTEQNRPYYVDCYSRHQLMLLTVCLLLSLADGFLTLHLLGLGAVEINPVMRYLLGFGSLRFVLVKYCLTAFGFIWLLVHENHFLPRMPIKVGNLFSGLLCLYAAVVLYQVVLTFFAC